MAILIYFQIFCQKSVETKSLKKYFVFIFHFDTRPGIQTPALLPTRLRQFLEYSLSVLVVLFELSASFSLIVGSLITWR